MNSLRFIVASNVIVACFIAVVAYSVGRWGKSAALAHLLWVAVFIKLITPPLVVAPVSMPSGWGSPFQSVYRVLVLEGNQRKPSEISNVVFVPKLVRIFRARRRFFVDFVPEMRAVNSGTKSTTYQTLRNAQEIKNATA